MNMIGLELSKLPITLIESTLQIKIYLSMYTFAAVIN